MRHAIILVVTIAFGVTTASADPIRIASGQVSWGESVETDVNYELISNEGQTFFQGQAAGHSGDRRFTERPRIPFGARVANLSGDVRFNFGTGSAFVEGASYVLHSGRLSFTTPLSDLSCGGDFGPFCRSTAPFTFSGTLGLRNDLFGSSDVEYQLVGHGCDPQNHAAIGSSPYS